MEAYDQPELTCERHGDSHELVYCVDCRCIVCIMCFSQSAQHCKHNFISLDDAKKHLLQQYEQLLRTVTLVRQSVEAEAAAATLQPEQFAPRLQLKNKQEMDTVLRMIDTTCSELQAIKLSMIGQMQAQDACETKEATFRLVELQFQHSRLQLSAKKLTDRIAGILQQQSLKALNDKLRVTLSDCSEFEQRCCDWLTQSRGAKQAQRVASCGSRTVVELHRVLRSTRAAATVMNAHCNASSTGSCAQCNGSETVFVVGFNWQKRQTFQYSFENDEWHKLSDTYTLRHTAVVTSWNNQMIVTGDEFLASGYDEKYDPRSNKWSRFPRPKVGRDNHAMANLNGCLFMIGGKLKGVPTNSVERFDALKQGWTDAPSLLVARAQLAVATTSRSIVVIGGVVTQSECEMFDEEEDCSWKSIAKLNTGRRCAAAACVADVVYVFGGRNLNGDVITVEQYDQKADKWTELGVRMSNNFRYSLTATVANGRIYLVGYANWNDLQVEAFDALAQQFVQLASPGISSHGAIAAVTLAAEPITKCRSFVRKITSILC